MTTLTVRRSASLFYRAGSSDKEYNLYIEDSPSVPSSYDVRVTWGRRGNANSSQHKAQGVSMLRAEATFESLKRGKESKGYKEDPSMATRAPLTQPALSPEAQELTKRTPEELFGQKPKEVREYTELKPQLLNPINVEDMEQYIWSPAYLAQEKLDGKRIMVEVNFGQVTASNRRSWKVGIPQDVEEELAKFDDCILDGELVGGVYYVFDCLGHNGEDIREQAYADRFNRLVETVIGDRMLYQVDIVPTAYDEKDKRALIESLKHKEGVVFKELNAPHSVGRPNKGGSQFKCKFWSSATCVVTKINTTANKDDVANALANIADGNGMVQVGPAFDIIEKTNKTAKRSVAVSVDSPDGFVPVGNVTVPPNYELPQVGDYVEIKYLYYYPGGALYQPQYLGVRDDVDVDVLASLKPKSEDTDE